MSALISIRDTSTHSVKDFAKVVERRDDVIVSSEKRRRLEKNFCGRPVSLKFTCTLQTSSAKIDGASCSEMHNFAVEFTNDQRAHVGS